jgi:hypothetical protein
MRRTLKVLGVLVLAIALSGCVFKGGTDLSDVAANAGLANVTTGDGTFENYTATGHYTGTEVGIGIGIPYLIKLIELYPAKSNEDLLTEVAQKAKEDKAEAMINVHPQKDFYTGFPFFLIGIYIDSTNGTGIKK